LRGLILRHSVSRGTLRVHNIAKPNYMKHGRKLKGYLAPHIESGWGDGYMEFMRPRPFYTNTQREIDARESEIQDALTKGLDEQGIKRV
jgi:hypothetical protein